MEDRIKKALTDIVGPANFSDLLIDLVSYSYDASDHTHRPEASVWPTRSEQVSEILKLANEHRFPVVPRGAGTSLTGAAVPVSGGLVLDLCRMTRIIDIRITDRQVVVQPGVVYADLEKALQPFGFCFPPDPASGTVCTLGGNVATNAGGMRGAKYGVTRDYVMGLEVVLPDGRMMRTAESVEETEELWRARKSVGSIAARLRSHNVSEDVTVPMSKVPDLLTHISAIVQKHGLPFVIFGHAGDGNFHPRIMYDRSDHEQIKKVNSAVGEIFELTCQLGGTLTGEHGIGLAKAPYMQLEHDPVALQLMASLKGLLDPNNILNPGKMSL